MNQPDLTVTLSDGDMLAQLLLSLGKHLKPFDDANFWFFEIVRELADASLTNFGELRRGYVENNYPLLAWACRNLLELSIFTRYVLISASNAHRFEQDRLMDGCEIVTSLRNLEQLYQPGILTPGLDDALNRMRVQIKEENASEVKHLEVRDIAELVEMREEYRAMTRVSSKLIHPTSWSVLAMNKGTNSFPESRELLFSFGVGYISQVYMAVSVHNQVRGMIPIQ